MKISLAEIKSLEKSLSKIFDKDLNIKIAYRLGILLKKITEELRTLEENRIRLIKKYGTKDEKTQQIQVPPDKNADFYKDFNELLTFEIDIDFEPISLNAFGDITLSAIDAMRLDGIVIKNDKTAAKKKKKTKTL